MLNPMSTAHFRITEYDEAGNETSTYVASGNTRVDVLIPKETKSYAQQTLEVFLPAGYPQSVTEDYIQYQIYDSLQAFSSSIAGLLASRAVLEGVGVGDSTASPTSALLLSILQESMGRLATILFAHRLGTSLEPECKMYRLAADIFNDTAMILDCLSPTFPKPARVMVLSFSSCLRALCGVCAGSAKASLSAHFAKRGNLGELNAKDSSQETVISLMGMLAGSLVVSWVHSPMATWATLMGLLGIHLGTNYAAVKAVNMTSLNRQRANIVFGNILQHGKVLSPKEVSQRERVFERDGVLRWVDDSIIGSCRIGVSLQVLLSRFGAVHSRTKSLDLESTVFAELLEIYAAEGYILWFSEAHAETLIVLKKDCTAIDQLRAWTHALLIAQRHRNTLNNFDASASGQLTELRHTLTKIREMFNQYVGLLEDKGWNLGVSALQTRAGVRAVIETKGH